MQSPHNALLEFFQLPHSAEERRRLFKVLLVFVLMPFIVVMLILASAFPGLELWLLIVASVGLVLLISWVALPADADDAYTALKQWFNGHRTRIAAALVSLAVVAILSFDHIRSYVPGQSWPGLFVQMSLVLWPLSLVLYQARRFVSGAPRLGSAFIPLLNTFCVLALPIIVFETRPEPVPLRDALILLVVAPLALFFVLGSKPVLRLQKAIRRRLSGKGSSHSADDDQRRARQRGVFAIASCFCAIAAAVLLLVCAIRVPIERRLLETSQVAERGAGLPAFVLENPEVPTAAERKALLERYSPVLRLHEHEHWAAYDASTVLAVVTPGPSESCAEKEARPCDEVQLEKALDRLPDDAKPPSQMRVFPGGAIYPRLVRVDMRVAELEKDVPPVAQPTRWLAQYWMFYPYNDWEARSALGSLKQRHGGDWEWVGVGLDGAGAPLFVAYSAHCGGTWRPWSVTASVAITKDRGVLVGRAGKFLASHPLVIVAGGSHANYPTPGAREPAWGTCGLDQFATKAMRWLTFAAAAREETPELGTFQVPTILTEDDTNRDARRPLWWGSDSETRLGRIKLESGEHGPPSPLYQSSWTDPIGTIFGPQWECDADAACR